MGAPLEDARHLTQRYERLRQEAEAQVSSQSYSLPSFAFKSHGFGFWFVSHPIIQTDGVPSLYGAYFSLHFEFCF